MDPKPSLIRRAFKFSIASGLTAMGRMPSYLDSVHRETLLAFCPEPVTMMK